MASVRERESALAWEMASETGWESASVPVTVRKLASALEKGLALVWEMASETGRVVGLVAVRWVAVAVLRLAAVQGIEVEEPLEGMASQAVGWERPAL
jgi:NAD(P)H-nitrite reductase large subunit